MGDLMDCGKARVENYWRVEPKNYIWLWEMPFYCFDIFVLFRSLLLFNLWDLSQKYLLRGDCGVGKYKRMQVKSESAGVWLLEFRS